VSARDDYPRLDWMVRFDEVDGPECEEALDEIDTLRGLVFELGDPDPCHYDHHDLCQAHRLAPRPCPYERANALSGRTPGRYPQTES
jgi:hypothetical protein